MPRLGEPVEPAQPRTLEPWWRAVEGSGMPSAAPAPQVPRLPRSVSWPLD